MSKSYSKAPDVDTVLGEMLVENHNEDLHQVSISTLFVFDTEGADQILTHQGYLALAVARITPLRERALGMADASVVVDRAAWVAATPRQRAALIDHELTHLVRVTDEETGDPLFDVLGRPKLEMRKHDHQFGWFDEIAQRHGDASPEVRQARKLMESSGQLYFDFGKKAA